MALELNSETESLDKADRPGILDIDINLRLGSGVSQKERMFFIEQLALMLETGSDLHTSLQVLMNQSENAALKGILQTVTEDINEGKTFSSALYRHPQVFSSTYVSLIAASESGGYLQRILEHLLEMEKQREALRGTLVSALSYPAFLIVFSIAMVVFILAVVFPKFADLFTSIQDQLPGSTIFLMALSDIITKYWWAVLGVGTVCILLGFAGLKSSAGKRSMDRFKLQMPFVRDICLKLYLIQVMRILGLSLKNGVPLIEALNQAKDTIANSVFHDFIDTLVYDVSEGRKLAHGFNQAAFIPPIVRQMITTGEETGNLALVASRIADYFQQELEKQLQFLAKAIEPLMLLVMGVVVGLLVSSLILPIFKLSQAVH